MPPSDSQQFLSDLGEKLWSAAGRRRPNLDVFVYKHAVLGLIFLRYAFESFAIQKGEIAALIQEKQSDFYLDPSDDCSGEHYADAVPQKAADRDHYIEKNVLWGGHELARWKTLQASAQPPHRTEIDIRNGNAAA